MTQPLQTVALALAFAAASTALVSTQAKDADKAAAARPGPNQTALKVVVAIGRFEGDKKISSMPYTLTLNANSHANLRMGTRIPVTMLTGMQDAKTPDGKPIPAVGPVQYQDVGTNIDCSATAMDDGRMLLLISVDDSSVYDDRAPGAANRNPSFRSFRATNSMILKNGETGEFTAATDKVTGETVRVDVTLTILK